MVTFLLLQLTLAFPPGDRVPPLTRATAIAEADRLWAPYGIPIDQVEDAGAALITIALADAPRRAVPAAAPPLGAIAFDAGGNPAAVIELYLAEIMRLVSDIRVLGAAESQWPPDMRQRIVGRVIGRVLAHEIGHYALRTPAHARAGLMRPTHLTPALAAPERGPFALSKRDAARLAQQADMECPR